MGQVSIIEYTCLTFDLMHLLDAYVWDRVNYSFYDSLYTTEQFEAVFIEIWVFWHFDPCGRNLKMSLNFDIFLLYLKNQSSNEFTVFDCFAP